METIPPSSSLSPDSPPELSYSMERWLAETAKQSYFTSLDFESRVIAFPARNPVPGENPSWEVGTGRVTTQPSRGGTQKSAPEASKSASVASKSASKTSKPASAISKSARATGSRTSRRARSRATAQRDTASVASSYRIEVQDCGAPNTGSQLIEQQVQVLPGHSYTPGPLVEGRGNNIRDAFSPTEEGYVDPQLLQYPHSSGHCPGIRSGGVPLLQDTGVMMGDEFVVQPVIPPAVVPQLLQGAATSSQQEREEPFDKFIDWSGRAHENSDNSVEVAEGGDRGGV